MSIALVHGINNNSRIAKIKNTFAEQASYELSSRQQKVLLYLIAKIDTRLKDFYYQDITIKELEAFLKIDTNSKWGDAYSEISNFIIEMSNMQFFLKSKEEYEGNKLPIPINVFQQLEPKKNDVGESIVEFMFSEPMKNYLINFTKDFVQIDTRDIRQMKNRYAIRLFQMLKAVFNNKMKHKNVVVKKITIEELRFILAVDNKYTSFKSFSQFVLKPAVKEINKLTPIELILQDGKKLKYIRKGRSIHAVEFYIMANKKYVHPSQGRLPFPKDKNKAKRTTKKAPFDIEQFKTRYSRIYLDLIKDIQRQFPQMPMENQAWQHALMNACETWYRKNA